MRFAVPALLVVLVASGCGTRPNTSDGGPSTGERLRQPNLGGSHLGSCEDPTCGGPANPPLGGDHCGSWLPCRAYDTVQLRCNWVHNLEHGHAVLAYNCPSGCPELVTQLTGIWQGRQADATKRRILVTPDPKLPKKIAAIVWGFGWQGDTFDAAAIEEALSHQDEEAPEKLLGCSQ